VMFALKVYKTVFDMSSEKVCFFKYLNTIKIN